MDDLIMGDLIEKGMVCIPRSKLLALSNFIQHSSNSFTEVEWCRHGITSGLRYMSQSSGCVSLLPANLEQVLSTEKYTVGISKNVSHPANLEFERLQWVSHHQYITFAEHYDLGFFHRYFF